MSIAGGLSPLVYQRLARPTRDHLGCGPGGAYQSKLILWGDGSVTEELSFANTKTAPQIWLPQDAALSGKSSSMAAVPDDADVPYPLSLNEHGTGRCITNI